jgi:hypothetical protein
MGNICSGAVLAAIGVSFSLAALLGTAKQPPSKVDDPIGYEIYRHNQRGRLPLFLFGLFFALFGGFIMAFK